MNCTEFKIWTETATEKEIISVSSNVQLHIETCSNCSKKFKVLQSAVEFMAAQKSFDLSEIKTRELVNLLSDAKLQQNKTSVRAMSFMSRIAVAAVILLGILVGVVAGSIITSTNSENNAWSNEFTLLSDNTDIDSYVFD